MTEILLLQRKTPTQTNKTFRCHSRKIKYWLQTHVCLKLIQSLFILNFETHYIKLKWHSCKWNCRIDCLQHKVYSCGCSVINWELLESCIKYWSKYIGQPSFGAVQIRVISGQGSAVLAPNARYGAVLIFPISWEMAQCTKYCWLDLNLGEDFIWAIISLLYNPLYLSSR